MSIGIPKCPMWIGVKMPVMMMMVMRVPPLHSLGRPSVDLAKPAVQGSKLALVPPLRLCAAALAIAIPAAAIAPPSNLGAVAPNLSYVDSKSPQVELPRF